MKKKKIFLIMALTGALVGLSSCNLKNDKKTTNETITETEKVVETTEIDDGSLKEDEITDILSKFSLKDYNYATIDSKFYPKTGSTETATIDFINYDNKWEMLSNNSPVEIYLEHYENITIIKDLIVDYKIYLEDDFYLVKFSMDDSNYELRFNKDGYIKSVIMDESKNNNSSYSKIELLFSFSKKDLYDKTEFDTYLNHIKRLNYNRCEVTKDNNKINVILDPIWLYDNEPYAYSHYFYILDLVDPDNYENTYQVIYKNDSYVLIREANNVKEEFTYDKSGYLTNYIKYQNGKIDEKLGFNFSYEEIKGTTINFEEIEQEVQTNRKQEYYAMTLISSYSLEEETDESDFYYDFIAKKYKNNYTTFKYGNPNCLLTLLKESETYDVRILEKDPDTGLYTLTLYKFDDFVITKGVIEFDENYYAKSLDFRISDGYGVEYAYLIKTTCKVTDDVITNDMFDSYLDNIKKIDYNICDITSNGLTVEYNKDIVFDFSDFDGFDTNYIYVGNVINKNEYGNKSYAYIYDGYFTVKHYLSGNSYELFSYDMDGYLVKYEMYENDKLSAEYEISFKKGENIQNDYDIDSILAEIKKNRVLKQYAVIMNVKDELNNNNFSHTWLYDFNKDVWTCDNSENESDYFTFEHYLKDVNTNYYYEIYKDNETNCYTLITYNKSANDLIVKEIYTFDSNYYLDTYETFIASIYDNEYMSHLTYTNEYIERKLTSEEYKAYLNSVKEKAYDKCTYLVTNFNNEDSFEFTNYKKAIWNDSSYLGLDSLALYLPYMFDASIATNEKYEIIYDDNIVIRDLVNNSEYTYSLEEPGYLLYYYGTYNNTAYVIYFDYSVSFDNMTTYKVADVLEEVDNRENTEEAVDFTFYQKGNLVGTYYFEKTANNVWETSASNLLLDIKDSIQLEDLLNEFKTSSDVAVYITKEDGNYVVTIGDLTNTMDSYIVFKYNSNYYLESVIAKATDDFKTLSYDVKITGTYCPKKVTKEQLSSLERQDYNKLVITEGSNTYVATRVMLWDSQAPAEYIVSDRFFIVDMLGLFDTAPTVSLKDGNYLLSYEESGYRYDYVYNSLGYVKEFVETNLTTNAKKTIKYTFSNEAYEINQDKVIELYQQAQSKHQTEKYAKATLKTYANGDLQEGESLTYNNGWEIPFIYFEEALEQIGLDDIIYLDITNNFYSIWVSNGEYGFAEYIYNSDFYLVNAYLYETNEAYSHYAEVLYLEVIYSTSSSSDPDIPDIPDDGTEGKISTYYDEIMAKEIGDYTHAEITLKQSSQTVYMSAYNINGLWASTNKSAADYVLTIKHLLMEMPVDILEEQGYKFKKTNSHYIISMSSGDDSMTLYFEISSLYLVKVTGEMEMYISYDYSSNLSNYEKDAENYNGLPYIDENTYPKLNLTINSLEKGTTKDLSYEYDGSSYISTSEPYDQLEFKYGLFLDLSYYYNNAHFYEFGNKVYKTFEATYGDYIYTYSISYNSNNCADDGFVTITDMGGNVVDKVLINYRFYQS